MPERFSERAEKARRAVRAAEGWLFLGATQAALEELESLEPSHQEQPVVLHQRARVLVALGKVKQAKAVVAQLARIAPDLRLTLLDDPALDPVWMCHAREFRKRER